MGILYTLYNKVNGCYEETNRNRYLMLVPINENKEIIKKYEELWSILRNLIRSIIKNADDYDQKYGKIKFNSDEKLPPNETIEIHSMVIVEKHS